MSSMFEADHPGWGRVTVFAIQTRADGSWEREWEPLRQAWLAEEGGEGFAGLDSLLDLVCVVDYHAWCDLRLNTARPLLDAGALSPDRCLTRLDARLRPCLHRASCPSWDEKVCQADHERQPPCFDVPITCEREALTLANRIVDLWRQDAWVFRYLSEEETLKTTLG